MTYSGAKPMHSRFAVFVQRCKIGLCLHKPETRDGFKVEYPDPETGIDMGPPKWPADTHPMVIAEYEQCIERQIANLRAKRAQP